MPPPSRVVVADSSPLISLDACNQLALLRRLYSRVIVPEEVERELSVGGATGLPRGLTRTHRKWIEVLTLNAPPAPALVAVLDPGEAEVIALALQVGCPLVLLDEKTARSVAHTSGLQVVGSLGILWRAKNEGLLPAIKPSTDLMLSRGVQLSKNLVDSMLRRAGEIP
jgi:uncharacterized protein